MFATDRYACAWCCVAAVGMMVSPMLAAKPVNAPAKTKVFDVKLADDGKLIGQVVNAAGTPQADVVVLVASKRTASVAETRTDEIGRFSLILPESGVYRVAVSNRLFTIRAWQANAAPPTSKLGLLCVTDNVVRGQLINRRHSNSRASHPRLRSFLTNPAVIGLGVAMAITLPISLDDNDGPIGAGEGLSVEVGDSEPAS